MPSFRSETKRLKELGKTYRNPYDFGAFNNWCLLLGVIDGRGWRSVLLPSAHEPHGDGLTWDSVYSCSIRWNDDRYGRKVLAGGGEDCAKIA